MQKPNLKNIDRTFWGLYIALIVVAIIALFSASSTLVYMHHSALGPIGQQMLFIVLGIIAAFGIQYIPSYWVRFGGYFLLAVSTLLVYSTMIPGNPLVVTINGAARWVRIAGITFQPSELAKLSLIIVVADQLARIHSEADKRKYFYRTLVIAGVVMLPVMASNLSTAVLIGLIIFCLWILARVPWKYTLSVVGIAVVALALGYSIVEFGFVRPGRQMHGPSNAPQHGWLVSTAISRMTEAPNTCLRMIIFRRCMLPLQLREGALRLSAFCPETAKNGTTCR